MPSDPRHLQRRRRRLAPMVAMVPLLALLVVMLTANRPVRAEAVANPALLSRALDATLVVLSDDDDAVFLGSATLWGDGNVVVTCAHVLRGRSRVTLRDRAGRTVSAAVTKVDTARDIAVISLNEPLFGPGLPPTPEAPPLGIPVFAFGAPLEMEFSLSRGIVSAPARQLNPAVPVRLIQHDAALNPGSSGGPLIDAGGALRGVNARIADGTRLFAGIAFAIPADVVAAVVTGALPPVPSLGVTARPLTPKIARALGLADRDGVLVDDVTLGGFGWRAGLLAGDVILALDGRGLRQPGDLALQLDARQGDQARIMVLRAGQEISLALDLTPEKPRFTLAEIKGQIGLIAAYSWETLGVGLASDTTKVETITQSSPGYRAGLAQGDVILAVNGSAAEPEALHSAQIDRPVVLLVQRSGRTLHILVDPWSNAQLNVPLGGANALDPAVSVF
ncbi:trypsin-like peptidase domain-containing protein [Pseudooceanicola sp.]|uniref:S1C family serine protease n=1 Tax=Pseudooceanicola sp. TaxID=1914328 RepID=UPI002617DB0A|nr:trypsin-like peptidase domain-containing protein [Pseudooceanicola sp.]MDF1855128.1 trypsin-like peptidase domain-containing protein [Pseudooceanicola sp.]